MKQLLTSVCVMAMVATPIAIAAEQKPSWLCISDQSVGFKFEKGQWTSAQFSSDKFVLKINTSMALDYCLSKKIDFSKCPNRTGYEFVPFGKKSGLPCGDTGAGTIVCVSPFEKTVFDKVTLRFINFYQLGYVDGDKPENTPAVTIGRCTPL